MNPIPQELVVATENQLTVPLASDSDGLQIQLHGIKIIKNKVEERKEAITKPLREALQSARDLFRPLEENIKQADARVREALLALESERQKEAAKLAKKVEAGKATLEEGMSLITSVPKGLFRSVQQLKITSRKDIPDKYWVIDEVLLRADLMAGKKVKGAILVTKQTVVSK